MKTKVYVCYVMANGGSKLMDARGRKGLKELIEANGLYYGGLQAYYADRGVSTQIKVEWSDMAEWSGGGLVREHEGGR